MFPFTKEFLQRYQKYFTEDYHVTYVSSSHMISMILFDITHNKDEYKMDSIVHELRQCQPQDYAFLQTGDTENIVSPLSGRYSTDNIEIFVEQDVTEEDTFLTINILKANSATMLKEYIHAVQKRHRTAMGHPTHKCTEKGWKTIIQRKPADAEMLVGSKLLKKMDDQFQKHLKNRDLQASLGISSSRMLYCLSNGVSGTFETIHALAIKYNMPIFIGNELMSTNLSAYVEPLQPGSIVYIPNFQKWIPLQHLGTDKMQAVDHELRVVLDELSHSIHKCMVIFGISGEFEIMEELLDRMPHISTKIDFRKAKPQLDTMCAQVKLKKELKPMKCPPLTILKTLVRKRHQFDGMNEQEIRSVIESEAFQKQAVKKQNINHFM